MSIRISKRNARSIRLGIVMAKSAEWLGPRHVWVLTTKDALAVNAYRRCEGKYLDRRNRRNADAFWQLGARG